MSDDYKIASEAAKTFDNVTVINSESVSSATGILVLIAQKLAGAGIPVENIISELEEVKRRLQCSFIIDTTDFMVKKELVSKKAHALTKALNLHPCLQLKEDRSAIGGLWMGSTRRAYRRYIKKALSVDVIPDEELAFVTYADVPLEMLLWIKEEISKTTYFDRIVFQQASAAVSSNCGPGSFGILYFVKSNKSYNLGSFFEDEKELASAALDAEEELTEQTDEIPEGEDGNKALPDKEPEQRIQEPAETSVLEEKEPAWYEGIPFIDGAAAIKNSGSEEAFKTVLKIFYESIPEKTAEIEGYYALGDWGNYTIKVHALKSSARLIGALSLADDAQLLEDAGKTVNIDFIRENHGPFMEDYKKFKGLLAEFFTEEKSTGDKPPADEYLVKDAYEGLQMAAEAMDCDMIDAILAELEPYAFQAEDEKRLNAIRECAGNFEYSGILEVLKEG
ncbi:MAG: DegV family protein [Lachnospiraceae bacterium]|nr:DegV family protein [Lachnospiraceae bacterium]